MKKGENTQKNAYNTQNDKQNQPYGNYKWS